MTAWTSTFSRSGRVTRLTFAGSVLSVSLYVMVSVASTIMQAADQIADLRESYRGAAEGEAKLGSAASSEVSPRDVFSSEQRLIAPDRGAAISSIQQTFQRIVVPPAKLESLHVLDALDHKGLTAVRASIRIRDLQPEQVFTLIKAIETTVPAIVFDDVRLFIRTQPDPFGSWGPSSKEVNSAEVSGVVQVYTTTTRDDPSPSMLGKQP